MNPNKPSFSHRFQSPLPALLAASFAASAALAGGAGVAPPAPAAPLKDAPPIVLPDTPPSKVVAAFDHLRGGDAGDITRIRLVSDNVTAWQLRWAFLERAERTIDMTYFVFDNDIFGRSLLGLLYKKARQGVKVRLMIDAVGGAKMAGKGQAYLRALAKLETAEIKVFNPKLNLKVRTSWVPSIKKIISANHDKIVLVDGREAITGGRNIGWHYFADPSDKHHTFADTDVFMSNEAVAADMKRAFEEEFVRRKAFAVDGEDWFDNDNAGAELQLSYHAMRQWILGNGAEMPEDFGLGGLLGKIRAELAEHPAHKGRFLDVWQRRWEGRREVPLKILDKHGRFGEKDEIKPALIKLVDSAERSIMIQNPYVILRKDIATALRRAAHRGVPIFLHTNGPASTNHMITQAYFLRDWKRMMRDIPTLRIFASKAGQTLHSKTFVIDGEVASVGTYNLDPLSTDINSELVALVKNREFTARLQLRMAAQMAAATEYKVARDGDGELVTVVGPEAEVTSKTRVLLSVIRQIPFLRGLL